MGPQRIEGTPGAQTGLGPGCRVSLEKARAVARAKRPAPPPLLWGKFSETPDLPIFQCRSRGRAGLHTVHSERKAVGCRHGVC